MSEVRVFCTEFDEVVDPHDRHYCREGYHMEWVQEVDDE